MKLVPCRAQDQDWLTVMRAANRNELEGQAKAISQAKHSRKIKTRLQVQEMELLGEEEAQEEDAMRKLELMHVPTALSAIFL